MLSEAELTELLDIRRKIDALQMRYNELAAKMAMPPSAAAAAPVAAPVAPVAPAPMPVAAPQPVPVAPPAAVYARPVAVAAAQPVAAPVAVPVAPVQPVQPVAQAVPASQVPSGELETKRFPAAAPSPGATPLAPTLSKDPATWTLKDYIVDILAKAGKPVTFEDVYKRLEERKAPMPKDKPKLVVRQVLYNKALFEVVRGAFTLAEGPGAAAAQSAAPKSPVVNKTPPADLFKHRLDAMLGKK